MSHSRVLRHLDGNYGHAHWCPGCEEMHRIPGSWTFDGNMDAPTFKPSVKVSGKLTVKENGRWNGEYVRDGAGAPIDMCCHYILTAGVLNFCADSTHKLAGQNVPLLPIPDHLKDGEIA